MFRRTQDKETMTTSHEMNAESMVMMRLKVEMKMKKKFWGSFHQTASSISYRGVQGREISEEMHVTWAGISNQSAFRKI